MLRIVRIVCIALPALYIAGCSSLYGDQGIIRNRDTEYLKAKTIAPLQIPEGYSGTSLQENYPVPVRHYSEEQKRVDLTPPELNSAGK